MTYYIYPNGKVGLDIKNILETINFKDEIRLIDDEFFIKNQEKILSGIILISSKKYYFEIARKCKKYSNNLIKYIDGMEFAANKLDEFVLNISPKYKNIGVILKGPAGSKHRGKVLEKLSQKGYRLFFFASSNEDIIDTKTWFKDGIFINCNEREIFKFLTSFSLLINEHFERFSSDTISLWIPHTISFADNKFLNYNDHKTKLYIAMMSCDFIVLPSKKDKQYVLDLTQEVIGEDLSYKILPFGSPSLEQSMQNYAEFKKPTNRAVLIAFGVVGALYQDEIIKLISYIIKNKFIVYFRPSPYWRSHNNLLSFVEKTKAAFKDNKNFFFDETLKISDELKKDVITIISDISSLTFTFALTTLKPSIIFIPKNSQFYPRINEICEQDIHIHANTKEKCLEKINQILNHSIEFKEKILTYRSNNIFSLSPSSKIADFIDEVVKLKYQL